MKFNISYFILEMKAFISISDEPAMIVNDHTGSYNCYDCVNTKGNQVCFQGNLYQDLDYKDKWHNDADNPFGYKLENWFPIAPFIGKREGDIVDLEFLDKKGTSIIIQALLVGSESKKFEDLLYSITADFGGITAPIDDTELSLIKQCCLIIAIHQNIADNLNKVALEPKAFKHNWVWFDILKKEKHKDPCN